MACLLNAIRAHTAQAACVSPCFREGLPRQAVSLSAAQPWQHGLSLLAYLIARYIQSNSIASEVSFKTMMPTCSPAL